ncbi:SAM-dependent methyltransferase [Streptomyces tsukubensis]|uniref:SAM-dependent methyltransferase n=1 Tax=Streptomyces tsukubensis TaxID=83656 RepID=UPI00344E466F
MSSLPVHALSTGPAVFAGASSARLWAACQGGAPARDAEPGDIELAAALARLGFHPQTTALSNRLFHRRAVAHAAALGIRQFLDVGCGLPAPAPLSGPGPAHPCQHDSGDGGVRVLCLDADPEVVRAVRARATGRSPGTVTAAEADLGNSGHILELAREHLDLRRPVCLLLTAVLDHLPDEAGPQALIRRLTAALAPGSCLVISHLTDAYDPRLIRAVEVLLGEAGIGIRARSRTAITALFTGTELAVPGLVPVSRWRQPDPGFASLHGNSVHLLGGLALVRGTAA